MGREDWVWAGGAVSVHLLLLAAIAWQNGGLEPVWRIHDAVYYTAHLADPLLQGDVEWWDNAAYRALRMGFVILALPVRWLGEETALVVVNLAALLRASWLSVGLPGCMQRQLRWLRQCGYSILVQ